MIFSKVCYRLACKLFRGEKGDKDTNPQGIAQKDFFLNVSFNVNLQLI